MKKEVKRECSNCGKLFFPLRKGRCLSCYQYFMKNGIDSSKELWDKRAINENLGLEVCRLCKGTGFLHRSKKCPALKSDNNGRMGVYGIKEGPPRGCVCRWKYCTRCFGLGAWMKSDNGETD